MLFSFSDFLRSEECFSMSLISAITRSRILSNSFSSMLEERVGMEVKAGSAQRESVEVTAARRRKHNVRDGGWLSIYLPEYQTNAAACPPQAAKYSSRTCHVLLCGMLSMLSMEIVAIPHHTAHHTTSHTTPHTTPHTIPHTTPHTTPHITSHTRVGGYMGFPY